MRLEASVYQAMHDFRKARRVKLLDVAEKMGMSAANLSNIESGRQKPPENFVNQAVEALGLKQKERLILIEAVARAKIRFSIASVVDRAKRERIAILYSKIKTIPDGKLSELEEILADYDIQSLDLSLSHINKGRHPLAPPMSFREISEVACSVRASASPSDTDEFDVISFLEFDLSETIKNLSFSVRDKSEMPEVSAAAIPQLQHVFIRNDIYTAAATGGRGGAFIIAHEIGHLVLHSAISTIPAENASNYRIYYDPEWQATKFAQCFLIPPPAIEANDTSTSLAKRLRVSTKVAEFQLRDCRKHGLIADGAR